METIPENNLCPRAEIAEYLDGELNAAERNAFESHLGACSICSEELSFQKHLNNVLNDQDNDEIEVPENYADVVIATAKSQVGVAPKRFEAIRFGLICLFMFALLGVSLVAMRGEFSTNDVSPLVHLFSKAFTGARNLIFGVSSIAHSVCIYSIFRSVLRVLIYSVLCIAASFFVYRMFNKYRQGTLK